MSSVDEVGAVTRNEGGETEDATLRALRADEAKEDALWKKRKNVLKRYPFIECLTTQRVESQPRISLTAPRSLLKRWYACKGCGGDGGGVHPQRWLEHLLHCEELAVAAKAANAVGERQMKDAFTRLGQINFKSDTHLRRLKDLRVFFATASQSEVPGSETDAVTNVKETGDSTVITESLATYGSARRGIERWARPPPSAFEITKINEAVSELIVESSIPFAWTSSPAFFKFMHALRPDLFGESEQARIRSGAVLASQPKNIRSRHWHARIGLDGLYKKRMAAAMREIGVSDELALAADGWQAEDGRKVINLAITVRETGREFYWRSVELGTETESAVFMQQTAAQVMQGLPLKKFKCIIGDNTGHVLNFLEAIAATPETSHVTPIGCFAHRFNLLTGDVVETFKTFFVDLERAINKLHVKTRMRALFDAARKEKSSNKQLETYCQTRWASAHVCLRSYVDNIDVLRFLDEDQGAIAREFRKLRAPDTESTSVLFCRESQIAVRQLEALFEGLAAANKFIEATDAHLAEILPLCWALEKDMLQWLANVKTSCHRSWIARATRKTTGDGSTCTTPEDLSAALKRVYDVRFKGLEAQPGNANTKRQPLRDEPLVHLATSFSFILHRNMRVKHKAIKAFEPTSIKGLGLIRFHSEEEKPDDAKAVQAIENMEKLPIPDMAREFHDRYSNRFVNAEYVEACTNRTFVDVTLEQLQYIRDHNWRRNLVEQEEVAYWPHWEDLIPYIRRVNAIVPHSASVERMNSSQKLVHNSKRLSLNHANVEKLTFIYFNATRKNRLLVSPFHRLASEALEATASEVAASLSVDAITDDIDGAPGTDEILSSDDDLDEYLKGPDELVMSPRANLSDQTEVTCAEGSLADDVPLHHNDSCPTQEKVKETHAQKLARKALERQEKERRSKRRRMNV